MATDSRARILVPLDGSASAEGPLEIAAVLARLMDAELHALIVGREPLTDDAVARRMRIPAAWRERVAVHSTAGDVVEAIREAALAMDATALVISSHGETRDLAVPAGHVTLGVLERPPCPVFVVRSALSSGSQLHRIQHLRRILVPLDGSAEAAESMAHGSALAVRTNARLLLLHIVDVSGRAPVAAPVYADQSQYELEAWRDEFIRSSFARAPRPTAVQADVALRFGEPGREIAAYASDEDCDLIVAAWGGRITPGRALVVRTLLARAPCPLLFLSADRD
jgi:nucleotide-binding universal stress UspA family protein